MFEGVLHLLYISEPSLYHRYFRTPAILLPLLPPYGSISSFDPSNFSQGARLDASDFHHPFVSVPSTRLLSPHALLRLLLPLSSLEDFNTHRLPTSSKNPINMIDRSSDRTQSAIQPFPICRSATLHSPRVDEEPITTHNEDDVSVDSLRDGCPTLLASDTHGGAPL